jgi:hypothetical protein
MSRKLRKVVGGPLKIEALSVLFTNLDANNDDIVTFEEWHKAVYNGIFKS